MSWSYGKQIKHEKSHHFEVARQPWNGSESEFRKGGE